MQDLNNLANVILEAATREKGRHNLIVMLRTDTFAVDITRNVVLGKAGRYAKSKNC